MSYNNRRLDARDVVNASFVPEPLEESMETGFGFTLTPQTADYLRLAEHLEAAPAGLHPALAEQSASVGEALRCMAGEPDRQAHQQAYHALRLFVP